MSKLITLTLSPRDAADSRTYTALAARNLGTDESAIALVRIIKRSIDARGRTVKVNLTLEIFEDSERRPGPVHFDYPDVRHAPEVIIVGAGPAGLFAALRLIELGLRPVVVERGFDVARRKRDIAGINRGDAVNPDSNYAFGEGGAGTFSDGKLFTRSKKRGDYNRALQTLVFHGAQPEIMYEAHPHIGTDKLPQVMTAIRKTITDSGGVFLFGKRMTDIIVRNGKIAGIACGDERLESSAVILAAGHSAADVYEMLHLRGIRLEQKAFAMGVRVEHPQALIDKIQYHGMERGEWLPAASYSLVSQIGGRGVYSFCMCPGGFIVPAMTNDSERVVNGMSPSNRGSAWANSGIVAEVREADYAHLADKWGVLAGLKFQRELEYTARLFSGDRNVAPAQRLTDFVNGRASSSLPKSSYVPGLSPSEIHKWLPEFIGGSLRGGLRVFGRRLDGFLTPEALVTGVESRTSSPVRIPRDRETLMHPETKGLFPAGEGAGYAGGIISAALDGTRSAEAAACFIGKRVSTP